MLAVLALLQAARRWTGEEELVYQVRGLYHLAAAALQPAPETEPFAAVAHTGVNPLGVNTFLELEAEPHKVERSLEMVAQAGFGFIRQEFPWEDIELHAKGDFTDRRHEPARSAWEKYDRIVSLAEKHGLEVIARLDKPPPWAGPSPYAPPDRIEDYADFVAAVVERYQGQVGYFQLWNEPNLGIEWGGRPDPRQYARLLCAGYQAAKAANPSAVILAAAMAPTTEQGPENLDDLRYWEALYEAGGGECFDVASAQAYGLWTGPADRRVEAERANFSRPILLRALLVEHGDADKPIWISEAGWNTVPPELPAPYGRVGPERQAAYTVLGLQRALNEWPWMGVMNLWFFRRPDEGERDQPFYHFRLVESSFEPRPAWEAVAAWSRHARAVYPGLHQEDHWAIDYHGPWAAQGGFVEGGPGANLRLRFKGTSAILHLRQGSGRARVTVDGRAQELALRPRLTLAQGLGDGYHEVEVEVLEGLLRFDGLLVRRDPWPRLATLLGWGGLGGLVLASGVWAWRRR